MFKHLKRETIVRLTGDKKYLPTLDFIVIKPMKSESMTAGGIHLPAMDLVSETAIGRIVRVGPGLPKPDGEGKYPLLHQVGEVVVINPKVDVFEIQEDREVLLVAGDRDVVAVLEGVVEDPAEAPGDTVPATTTESPILVP